MNLPNKITLTRIFMIPVFVAVYYLGLLTPWCYLAAAVVFLLAAATDALDGHIARSRHLVTDLGKFLDPIADKVLVSTAFIVLLATPAEYTPFTVELFESFESWGLVFGGICVAVIMARELIVSGFRMIAAGKNLVLAADKLGKFKTTFQDIAIVLLILSMFLINLFDFTSLVIATVTVYVGLACLVICTVLTVVSGVNYLVKNKAVLKDAEANMQAEAPRQEGEEK